MFMQSYCPEFKRNLVQKMLAEGGSKTVEALAKEHGVSRATAFRWVSKLGPEVTGLVRRNASSDKLSMAAKLRILLETRGLSEQELGEYLRRKGIYYAHLMQWRDEVLQDMAADKNSDRIPKSEEALVRRIRELERELKLKDKALKEATAILALKKKAASIWGGPEGEKSPSGIENESLISSKKEGETEPG